MRTNWVRKYMLRFAAAGLVCPAAVQAAPVGVNLVQNPSFEDVEGKEANVWVGAVNTYAYSMNYTGPAPPGAGDRYWYGGAGDTLTASQPEQIELYDNAVAVDAGKINYDLSAFFSSYLDQGDYGAVTVSFLAEDMSLIDMVSVGGQDFNAGIPFVDNGTYTNARAWAQDSNSGGVPAGSRLMQIDVTSVKAPVGAVIDGYVDMIDFRLSVVPEPGSLVLFGLGALATVGWKFRRRR